MFYELVKFVFYYNYIVVSVYVILVCNVFYRGEYMVKIKVVMDLIIDLMLEEVEKYGIEMIFLCINIDNEMYLDCVELMLIDFIEKMKNLKELLKSF